MEKIRTRAKLLESFFRSKTDKHKRTDKQQGQSYREVKHIMLDYVNCVEWSMKYFYKYFCVYFNVKLLFYKR